MITNLKKIRKASGMKQSDVAEKMEVSVEAYRTWESGRIEMRAFQLVRLAQIFGCTVDDILISSGDYDTMLNQIIDAYRSMDERGKAKLFADSVELHYKYVSLDNREEDND